MPNIIRAFERSLADLFCDKFLFSIPPFQRPYAWTREQAGELLDDLQYALRSNGAGSTPYFLGTIVVIKDPDRPAADVVDGQQRLATLTILLSVLRDLAEPNDAEQIDKYVRQEGRRFEGINDSFRVNLREQDRNVFQKYIQTIHATDSLPDVSGFESDSQSRLIDNAAFLREILRHWTNSDRIDLLTYIVQNCYLVVVQATDREAAYRVFAVMNDRGLDLSPTDVLKAEIIGSIPDADRDTYNSTWELLEEGLGRDRFRELFNHINMVFHRQKRRTSLEQSFRDHVLRYVEPAKFIDEFLEPFGENYMTLVDASYRSSEHAEEINSVIRQLWRLDYSDWQPVALYSLVIFGGNSGQLLTALRRLERLAYGFFILRTHVNMRVARFSSIIDEMIDNKGLQGHRSSIDLSDEDKAQILSVLNGPIYPITRLRKLLLLRLDEALADAGASYDHRIVSVEHVLPQRPKADSEWVEKFPNQNVRRAWTHRLANLVLLSRKKNAAAGNMEFDQKKRQYFSRTDGTSPFAITSQVIVETDWTLDVLERRQELLVGKLADLWDLSFAESDIARRLDLTIGAMPIMSLDQSMES
ncbi:MAG: DUF262 domain-containing protein [Pseudomonadota bacterium]